MTLPPENSRIWREFVTGEKRVTFEFLAIKIFLGRAQLVQFNDSSEGTIASLAKELRQIFEQNISHPAVVRDMEKLRS